MSLNLNDLAVAISELEGGKVNLPIAQIKEVMRCMFIELGKYIDEGPTAAEVEIYKKCLQFYRRHQRRERAKGKGVTP